jgi:hypothetical protein
VKFFYYLLYNGIVENLEVHFFNSLRFATVPLPNPAGFSQSRCKTRPACRLRRHNPGEAGVGASFACAPGAEREKFPPLNPSRYRYKFNPSAAIPLCYIIPPNRLKYITYE